MKINIKFLILFLSAMFICASCSNDTELNLYSTLNGKITDMQTGDPIKAATITLSPGGMTTVSSINGTFEFVNLDAGQYTIIVQCEGYMTNRKLVNAIAGEIHQVDIPIKKL